MRFVLTSRCRKGVSAAYSFKCKSQKGAIVIPGDYGMLHYVLKNDAFLEYITRHHHSWYELARSRKLSVNPEDIVLVSGWLKTSEWAMAALVNEGSSHALSFSADGCSVAQARFGVERSSDVEMSAFQRSGPGDVTNKIRDQCLFIRYYKAKYRAGPLKFLGMKIVAHAGPHRLDRYHDTEDPAAGTLQMICSIALLIDVHQSWLRHSRMTTTRSLRMA